MLNSLTFADTAVSPLTNSSSWFTFTAHVASFDNSFSAEQETKVVSECRCHFQPFSWGSSQIPPSTA